MKDDIADDNGEKAVVEEYRPVPVRSEKQLSAKKKKSLHLGLMKHEMPAFEHKSTGVTPGRIPSQVCKTLLSIAPYQVCFCALSYVD